jgi:hypothetical protein
MLVSLVCRYGRKKGRKEGENIPIICGVTGLRNSLSRARFEYAFGSAREGIAVVCISTKERGRWRRRGEWRVESVGGEVKSDGEGDCVVVGEVEDRRGEEVKVELRFMNEVKRRKWKTRVCVTV